MCYSLNDSFGTLHAASHRHSASISIQQHSLQQWSYFPYYVNKCAPQNRLPVQGFSNTDELKYHVMPTKYMSNTRDCTIVSLGIGKDVEAEKSMQSAMPNCQFWGADPVNETNADIFPEVGKFYNIAVGAENGTFRSYVLEDIYRYQEVKYVDIATFLRNYVKRSVIDQIMIDIEHLSNSRQQHASDHPI
ncbi:unnamed protein product [Heligmosomoides polygyrus]|uniref:Methyltransf_21 domain-containing protein n=1 Tax=Heligmosomoides polygyrus TaxID=6339 RepID=A0A183GMV6_HELPZ|nr:unnamed protein product [Heligmosomoides polygyrus]